MLVYIKEFVSLFVLLALLIYLTPQKHYQKYIRFFAELILTVGILSPALALFGGSEKFLDLIAYEEFEAGLSEFTRDMERMEYIHQDAYIGEYEEALAEDVTQIAGDYGFAVREASVRLGEDYTVKEIVLILAESEERRVVIGEIVLEEEDVELSAVYAGLVQKLSDYYKVDSSQIKIVDAP